MLTHLLLDRLLSSTLLYAAVLFTTYTFRAPLPPVLLAALVLPATAIYLIHFTSSILSEARSDRLGARSPSVRTWTPFNLGLVSMTLYYFAKHRSHQHWWWMLGRNRNAHHPWTVEALMMGARVVFTIDEENIKAVLATKFADFGKGAEFRREWKDFLGLSIFTTDGELWHNSRGLLRPQFVKDRVSDLHTFEHHVQALLPALRGAHDGATIRADDLFFRFTLDAATDFLLGQSVDSLQNPQVDFAKAFADVQRTQGAIARAGPFQSFIPRKAFLRNIEIIDKFVGQYIDKALELKPEELEKMTKTDEGYTFLHALASFTRDRTVLRDQLVAVLLAGRDTTAITLSWLFYELSHHPQVVQKLRDEIEKTVGFDQLPTYADLKSMRYLQHTLNETLRLYPVVPDNVRVALQDTTLPRGGGPDGLQPIAIPKDTILSYSTFCMQRREDIYPPTSAEFPHYLEFAPERWDSWTPRPWTYIPFNGGPRLCIGQQFALTELAYTVVRILQTFQRVESRQTQFPGYKTDIVMQPMQGVKLALFR